MWSIVGILAIGSVIAVIEVPSRLKNKQIKELCVFILLLLFGLGLGIAQSLKVNIPNPMDGIYDIIQLVNNTLSALWK